MRISDWSSDVCSSDLGSSRGPTAVTRKSTSASTFTCGPSGSRARAGWNGWSSSERGWTKPEMQSEPGRRSEEHTSELQSLMRISYADFCLKKKNKVMTVPELANDRSLKNLAEAADTHQTNTPEIGIKNDRNQVLHEQS